MSRKTARQFMCSSATSKKSSRRDFASWTYGLSRIQFEWSDSTGAISDGPIPIRVHLWRRVLGRPNGNYAADGFAEWRRRLKRDLVRLARLGWMILRFAALSNGEVRTCKRLA